ncbi:MAG: hypothetical protein FJ148_28330, partial [Deltaproteobacteria bacterium]|nr:hypothetical protein [Deltaproteobacteria bacterium]
MRPRESGMWSLHRRWHGGPFAVLCAVLACLAPGAAGLAAAADDEPGVARVALVEGDASYLRGDADDWTGVAVNAPLVTGDRLFTGADSRAEIQLDPSTYARLSGETEVSMLELGPDVTQVRMSLGLATYRVRRPPQGRHVEIDTPGGAFVVREAGVYRVSVARNGDTDLQVRDGEVSAFVAGEPYQIGDGRGIAIDGIGDAARPRIYAASGADGWDEWESQRAGRIENAVSTQYVGEEIYGAADLDDHGDWETTDTYGPVWRPRVAAGWAPYTNGRWVWVDPWGWTWLDYAAWGWAPFHYGRWVYRSGWWGWAPGPIVAAPVYAPALVGWYGGGGGVSVSVGFGALGWTPLGWGEPCYPWWGGWGGVAVGTPWWGGWGGPRYYSKNVTNITINNYEHGNTRHPGGLSSMPIGDFQNGRGRPVPVGSQRLDSFRALGGRVPVTPTRDSLPAADPSRGFAGRAIQPPAGVEGRTVMSARMPTAGAQPSFERKLPQIQRGQGTPLTPTTLRELGRDGGRVPIVQAVNAQGGAGRQAETLPPVNAPGGGRAPVVEASETTGRASPWYGSGTVPRTAAGGTEANPDGGFERPAPERAGVPRQTAISPSAQPPTGERGSPDTTGVGSFGPSGSGARGILRSPATGDDGGRALPVAPRAGDAGRTPYVARRPAWSPPSDAGTAGGGNATGGGASTGQNEVGRGRVSPRTSYESSGGGSSVPAGGRAATRPPVTSPGTAPATVPSRPTVRSSDASGGPSVGGTSARALPGGGGTRAMPSAPRSGSSAATYSPAVRSASAPDRGGGSRSYFSAPRTAMRSTASGGATAPRTAMRSEPTSRRGTSQPQATGAFPRVSAGVRSAPGDVGRAPQV